MQYSYWNDTAEAGKFQENLFYSPRIVIARQKLGKSGHALFVQGNQPWN
jgi:hypothetical protein